MAIRRHRSAVLLSSLTIAALSLTACGSGSDTSASPEGGATTASAPAEAVAVPSAEQVTPELPVTFTGDDGTEIEVTSLDRVFVLDDPTIEIMQGLGLTDNIAIAPEGSALDSELPESAQRVKTTGSSSMTVEGVAALEPTLVIGTNMRRQGEIIEKLQAAEIPATMIDRSQEPADKIRKTATLLGAAAAGEDLAGQVQQQLDEAAKKTEGIADDERARVMVLSSSGAGDSGNTTAAGVDTPADGIITKAGAINTGAETGLERYQSITPEGLISASPEVILVAASELDQLGGEDGIWDHVDGLSGTPAAENKRLIVMDDMQLTGGGLSAGAGVLSLQNALAEH